MCPYDREIEAIKGQLAERYHPVDIILFGSCAKKRVSRHSDVDICVVMETGDKRQTVRDMLLTIDYEVDLDIVVYTPQEWQKYKDDQGTFAGVINRTGVSLLG